MSEGMQGQQKFTDFYNSKSLKHSAFIIFYYTGTTVFTLTNFENSYSISFYLSLIFLLVYTYAEEGEIYYSAPSLKKRIRVRLLRHQLYTFVFLLGH